MGSVGGVNGPMVTSTSSPSINAGPMKLTPAGVLVTEAKTIASFG
jgi:hypothetical protein